MTNNKSYTWGGSCITETDWKFIKSVLERYNVKSVLEFGSGLSTRLFIENGYKVSAFETNQTYFDHINKTVPNIAGSVTLWDGTYLDIGGRFDLAFVDGPSAWKPSVGSREVSTRIASEHSDLVIVHDCNRAPELKWQETYLKPGFRTESSGGGCRFWIRKKDLSETIDIHVHASLSAGIYHPERNDRFPPPVELSETMEVNGIDMAVVMSMVSPECQYCFVTSDEVLNICKAFPDRLIPFMGVDPRMIKNGAESNFRDMLEHYKGLGCKGIGEYTPNLPINNPLNMNLFRQAEEAGLPIIFHMSPQVGGIYGCYDELGLPRLESVLKAFPNLVMIGHSTVFWSEIGTDVTEQNRYGTPQGSVASGRVPTLMREYPNLHGDLSAMSGYNAISRDKEFGCKFLEEFSDRIHFGTDIAKHFQRLPLSGYLKDLCDGGLLAQDTYEKIMWRNTSELLDI